ncbi:hypothetical protein ACM66B_006301 [Microbotryomycetes sp. NB124-2]
MARVKDSTKGKGVSLEYTSSEGEDDGVDAAQASNLTTTQLQPGESRAPTEPVRIETQSDIQVEQEGDASINERQQSLLDPFDSDDAESAKGSDDKDFQPSERDEDSDYDFEGGNASNSPKGKKHKRSRSSSSNAENAATVAKSLGLPRKVACTECYRRKTTCSGVNPHNQYRCTNCTRLGILNCQPRERARISNTERKRPILVQLHEVTSSNSSNDPSTRANANEVALIGLVAGERGMLNKIPPPPRISRRVGELSPHAAASLVNEFFAVGGWRLPLEETPFEFTREYLVNGRHQNIISELIFQTTIAHAARWTFQKPITHCRIATLPEIQAANTDQRNHLSITREKRIDVMRDKALKMLGLTQVRKSPKFEHLCALYMLYKVALTVRWEESRLDLLVQIHRQYLSLKPSRRTMKPEQQAFLDHVARKFMLWDASTSIYLQRPLLASDELLESVYDWSTERAQKALVLFREIKSQKDKKTATELQMAVFDVVIHCFRLLAQDPYDPAPAADEWLDTVNTLAHVRQFLAACYSVLQVVPVAVDMAQQQDQTVTTATFAQLNEISAWLISVEAALTHHTERICQHVLATMSASFGAIVDPGFDPKGMIDAAQIAFLHALKVDLYFCAAEELNNPFSARQRINSHRLSLLEAYPRYLETALVGATHHGIVKSQQEQQSRIASGQQLASNVVLIPRDVLSSEFPLAPVDFGIEHVERLCTCLNAGAWFSAVASERATALGEALVQSGLVRQQQQQQQQPAQQ